MLNCRFLNVGYLILSIQFKHTFKREQYSIDNNSSSTQKDLDTQN